MTLLLLVMLNLLQHPPGGASPAPFVLGEVEARGPRARTGLDKPEQTVYAYRVRWL